MAFGDHFLKVNRWILTLAVPFGVGLLSATSHATSLETPSPEDVHWGPAVIPVEGVVVVFLGPDFFDFPGNLYPEFTVVGPDGTDVPGETSEMLGTDATGDLMVWRAREPLGPSQRYDVTLRFDGVYSAHSVTTAADPAPAAEVPIISTAAFTEAPQTSACRYCQLRTDDPICIATEYEYRPMLSVTWQEPDGALDQRYLRYRWIPQQPNGSYSSSSDDATRDSGSDSRDTTLAITAEDQAGELCVALEAWSLIDGTTSRAEPICAQWTDLVSVPHDPPEPQECPEGYVELDEEAAADEDGVVERRVCHRLADALRGTTRPPHRLGAVAST